MYLILWNKFHSTSPTMFSRMKHLIRVCVFQNAFRTCHTQSGLEGLLNKLNGSPPKQGYSLLFFDEEVQKLLKKVSNIDLQKVFRTRTQGKQLGPPVYKFMTTEQLEKETRKALKRAEELLQLPPLVNIADDEVEILDSDTSLDGFDTHHSKHIFIDISYNKTNERCTKASQDVLVKPTEIMGKNRAIVVREPNGVLRTANRSERLRVNQIYNPMPGREVETPKMFSFENLKDVIRRKEYEFILDRACAQFEPDELPYHEVITLTYEAVNYCSDFPVLHSTRHFGSLVFYLITHQKIDNLLIYNITNDRIEDAFSIVKLYHLVHPNCCSAKSSKDKTDMEILKDFIHSDSKEKSALHNSLVYYEKKEQSEKELASGIKEAHGI